MGALPETPIPLFKFENKGALEDFPRVQVRTIFDSHFSASLDLTNASLLHRHHRGHSLENMLSFT